METKERTYRKMYVDIICEHKKDGSTLPIKFRLEDDTVVVIDRVKFSQRCRNKGRRYGNTIHRYDQGLGALYLRR